MPAYVLTGTPGSGKTAILRQLEVDGHRVVEEAATDVIALHQALGDPEPWRDPAFIDRIVGLQHRRRLAAESGLGLRSGPGLRSGSGLTFFDRSPVCTLALSRYAGVPASALLREQVEQAVGHYERGVFFVRNLGFVQPTAARRITLPDALRFERIHEETYREVGFDLIEVPAAPLTERMAHLLAHVNPPGRRRFRWGRASATRR